MAKCKALTGSAVKGLTPLFIYGGSLNCEIIVRQIQTTTNRNKWKQEAFELVSIGLRTRSIWRRRKQKLKMHVKCVLIDPHECNTVYSKQIICLKIRFKSLRRFRSYTAFTRLSRQSLADLERCISDLLNVIGTC